MQLMEHTLPSGARLIGYLRDETAEMPGYNIRPAVIVMPGGGYRWCSKREADPVAVQFLQAGYQVFTLYYTVEPAPLRWQPLMDAAGAVMYLRQNAAALRLDPGRVVVAGFSAGGHLAASTAILWDAAPVQQALGITGTEARPNAVVLGYPVITAGEFAHRSSFDSLCGDDAELLRTMSLENQVRPGLPPFFVWHTVADEAVPVQNSLMLAQALERNNVPYELHLFATGGHGSSTCTNEVNTPNPHNTAWLPLCMSWLSRELDFHL
ncbi:alpha/beta hydrolase [Gemmiger sp.]|uniref:alpha/beta hydrolase n=1 Tax=Gemmiger sp. TaxID=2049027 RepID=UPI003F0B9E0F